jgi:uncharacterized membrane protein YfcA
VPIDPVTVIAVVLVIALAAVAQSMSGIGFGLIAGPGLALLAPDLLPGALLVGSLFVLVTTLVQNRSGISIGTILMPGILSLPGALLGSLALISVENTIIRITVGLAVVAAVISSAAGARLPSTPASLAAAGFFAGALSSIASIPAPPLVLVYRPERVEQVRANLSLLFLFTTTASLGTNAIVGKTTTDDIVPGIVVGIVAVIAQVLARPLARRIQMDRARQIALGLSLVAGISLLVDSAVRLVDGVR